MRNGGFTGWAAALLLALLSGFLLVRLQERTGELANLRAEMGRLQATAQETATSLESLRAAVDQIQKQAAPPTGAAAPAPAPAEAATGPADAPDPDGKPSIAKLLSMLGQEEEEGDEEKKEEGFSPLSFMKMFEGEGGEAMIAEVAEMTMAQMYEPWMDEMAFSPEVEAQVRAVFLEHQKALMRSGQHFLGGDFSGVTELPTDDTLRNQLAGMLTPEAMAAYDTYMADLPERMAEEAVDMQLLTQARGLSPEGRELFKAVLVEEQLAFLPGNPAAALQGGGDADAFMGDYAGTYGRALERLREDLSESDLRILERFVERNRRMHEVFQDVAMPDAPKPE